MSTTRCPATRIWMFSSVYSKAERSSAALLEVKRELRLSDRAHPLIPHRFRRLPARRKETPMATHVRSFVLVVLAAVITGVVLSAQAITGPSSSASPYFLPAEPGVVIKSILTVGDAVEDYRMVGIPDGLGAFDNDD